MTIPSRVATPDHGRAFVLRVAQLAEPSSTDRASNLRTRSLFRRSLPSRLVPWKSSGLPSSSESPPVNMPCSFRPRPGDSQSVVCESLLPSTRTDGVGLTAISGISGLHHTACSLAVYASPRGSLRATQDLLPAGHHPLLDRVQTCRLSLKGFRFLRRIALLRHLLSPFRSFLALRFASGATA